MRATTVLLLLAVAALVIYGVVEALHYLEIINSLD